MKLTKVQKEVLEQAASRFDGDVIVNERRKETILILVDNRLGRSYYWGGRHFVINDAGRALIGKPRKVWNVVDTYKGGDDPPRIISFTSREKAVEFFPIFDEGDMQGDLFLVESELL